MNQLSQIIRGVNARLVAGSTFIKHAYGVAVKGDRVKDKADYIVHVGNGELIPVTDFDKFTGSAFWVRNTNVLLAQSNTQNQLSSCADVFDFTYPMRLVTTVFRSEIPCDNDTAVDAVAEQIIRSISGKYKASDFGVMAQNISIAPKSYQDNFLNLILPYTLVVCVIDFNFALTIRKDCMSEICENKYQSNGITQAY